jgi:hypothetical protein
MNGQRPNPESGNKLHLAPEDVDSLLADLCVTLGFCLPPGARNRLRNSPPRTVDRFTDVVFEYEGLDPTSVQHAKRLRPEVQAMVSKYFEATKSSSNNSDRATSRDV